MADIKEPLADFYAGAYDELCTGCKKNPATGEAHSCPYQSDVNDDHDEGYCNCCSDCEQQCADDI